MSITGLSVSDPDRMFKKPFHCRNKSGELDVFEAARYFSAANNESSTAGYTQKIMREERLQPWRGGRISLDVLPMASHHHHHHPDLPHHHHHNHHHHGVDHQKQTTTKEKNKDKHKQPSSPGGRLASFLNSLFNQTGSKKKKSKSTTQSMKDEDESPGGRRKRRSSISHFRSSSTTDTKSLYSSSSSGFRTPPPYKEYSLSKHAISGQSKVSVFQNDVLMEDKRNLSRSWVDEKFKNTKIHQADDQKEFIKNFNNIDDGAESDSSSDLFELQNYELGIYSGGGLPVYETTRIDSIKRGTSIQNAAAL